jgi:hypothetical protein
MRRRKRRNDVTPTMFPFLAVLICTMGALIALLVIGVQQARVHANHLVDQRSEEQLAKQEDLRRQQIQLEDYQWEKEVLIANREEKEEQLRQSRLKLANVETHINELYDKVRLLKARREALQNRDTLDEDDTTQEQLDALRKEIESATAALKALQAGQSKRKDTFAILPYKGLNGTIHRPIYLECTSEGVVFQPEGVLLPLADLQGPLGPGNPLDAGLRTIREFYDKHAGFQDDFKPYPLIVVRPDGVESYGRAMAAIKSWKDEFGYELIDADVNLTYGNPQPLLATEIQTSLRRAKERQKTLIAAMPSRFGSKSGFSNHSGSRGSTQSTSADPTARPQYPGKRSPGANRGANSGRASSGNGQQDSETHIAGGGGNGGASSMSGTGQSRKPGWALPDGEVPRTGVHRPVHVVCEIDKLTIVPGRGEQIKPLVTKINDTVYDNIDEFITSLHTYMDTWGLSVVGGQWKPELSVEIKPGGGARFRELRTVLQGSGVEVQVRR